MTGIKYAVLLLDGAANNQDGSLRQLAPNMLTWYGKLSTHIDQKEVAHWREWLGTMAWNDVLSEQRIVLTWMESERPQVSDHESIRLQRRLQNAWQGFLFAAPQSGCVGNAMFFGGEAESIEHPIRLRSINRQGEFPEVEHPLYRSEIGSFVSEWTERWIEQGPWEDAWLERWIDWVQRLERVLPSAPQILNVAIDAFNAAMSNHELEFSVPEFVRAIECIVAIPRNQGQKAFAQRALQIAPNVVNDWYVGGADLQARIEQLYQHRSDCVHGKVPFFQLRQQGEAGGHEAGRFEFLAETIAREAISVALRNPDKFPEFKDRDTLEKAWANATMPPTV